MKNALLVVCVITLLLVVGWTGHGQKKTPGVMWEYMVKTERSFPNSRVDLKIVGSGGWELTAVTTRNESLGDNQMDVVTTYYFKRQINLN